MYLDVPIAAVTDETEDLRLLALDTHFGEKYTTAGQYLKIKLDENLPVTLAARLTARGFDADTVRDEGLEGRTDEIVWQAAQQERRFLVTQDLDFSDTRKFRPGTHFGILLVRLPDSEQWRVSDYVDGWLTDRDAESWTGCVVVATPNKVRIIRPGKT